MLRFYQYDRGAGAANGVCIRADVQPSYREGCSVAATTKASSCLASFKACLVNNSTQAASRGATVSATCGCYTDAQDCLAQNVCSDLIRSLTINLQARCVDSNVCRETVSLCAAQALPANNFTADVRLFVRRHDPYTTAVSGVYTPAFLGPPLSASSAEWQSSLQVGSKTMAIWSGSVPPIDDSVDALLIGAVAGGQRVLLELRATPLSGDPVTVEGPPEKMSAQAHMLVFTAEDVRLGRAWIRLSLVCDYFQDPADFLRDMAARGGVNVSAEGVPVRGAELLTNTAQARSSMSARGANLLLAGISSSTNSGPKGWNSLLKPRLLLSNASFTTFELGRSSATLSLPAVPDFDPIGDELLMVTVPEFMLQSGARITLASPQIRIRASRSDCVVTEWSAWSSCTANCAWGIQTRARGVLTQPRGSGLACLPTSETRACNSCDPCSVVQCARGGACVGGTCFCPAGWAGERCELPAFNLDGLAFSYAVDSWSDCSAPCGPSETRTRSVECQQVTAAGTLVVPLSRCEAALSSPAPRSTLPCNTFLCASNATTVNAQVAVGVGMGALQGAAAADAFMNRMALELSSALLLPQSLVQVLSFVPSASQTVVSFSFLPPSAEIAQGVSPLAAARSLQALLSSNTSTPRSGSYAPFLLPLSYTFSLISADGRVILTGNVTSTTPAGSGLNSDGRTNSGQLSTGWAVAIVFGALFLLATVVVSLVGVALYKRREKAAVIPVSTINWRTNTMRRAVMGVASQPNLPESVPDLEHESKPSA
jgi:hypothetical protein